MKRRCKGIILSILIICFLLMGCGNAGNSSKGEAGSCRISVDCITILNNMDKLDEGLEAVIPKDGIILEETEVAISEGESVYDVLTKVLKDQGILMEASFTGNNAYIEGINNIYEFSCGELSGWAYSVNGEWLQVGCSQIEVRDGDVIEWKYTCDLGEDVKN